MVTGSFFIWLLCPFGMLPSLWIFFLAFPYFLTLQSALGSPCIFPSPAPESVISPRTTWCLSLCLHMPSCLIFPTALWCEEHYPPSQVWIRKETLFAMRMEAGASVWVNICLLHLYLRHLYGPVILQNGAIPSSQFGDPQGCRGGRTKKESRVESSRGKKELVEVLLWWDFYVYRVFTQLSSSVAHHSNCPALMRSLCLQSIHMIYLSPHLSSPSMES